jgi:hypothetical protein
VKAKKSDTSESWIGAVFFVMNIAHYLRVIFLSFLQDGQNRLNIIKNIEMNGYMISPDGMVLYHDKCLFKETLFILGLNDLSVTTN